MTDDSPTLVVVGGGILGTMHAIEGVRRGYEVTQVERNPIPQGASVRNFGLVWVSGVRPGRELELALRARERWEEIAAISPAIGFRPSGSLTVATSASELAAIEAAAELPDAALRGFRLIPDGELRERYPTINPDARGALLCERDAVVEPREVLGALRTYLSGTGAYRFVGAREIIAFSDHEVTDERGERYRADIVVVCPGADAGPGFRVALEGAPIRPVYLQMLETEPAPAPIGLPVADGNTIRYYPAFASIAHTLASPHPLAEIWGAHLLLAQRRGGHLTIGDTHRYAEPFPFDFDDTPMTYLLERASSILRAPIPPVERRWTGVYSEATDPSLLYYRAEIAPGVTLVTGPGGRGMTLSPAIAEESFA